MTSALQASQIEQDRLAQLVRNGPAQARHQELQGACLGLAAFFIVLFSSVLLQ